MFYYQDATDEFLNWNLEEDVSDALLDFDGTFPGLGDL